MTRRWCWFVPVLLMIQVAATRADLVSVDWNLAGTATASGDVGVFAGQSGAWEVTNLGVAGIKSTSPSASVMGGGADPLVLDLELNTDGGTWGAYDGAELGDALRRDCLYLNDANASFSKSIGWRLGGLVPGGSYDLAFYGFKYSGALIYAGTWTIGGTALTNFDGAAVTGQVVFNDIVASAAGEISGTFGVFTGDGSSYSAWSGMQIRGETPQQPSEPRVYHVAVAGDDTQDGSEAAPLQTISEAARRAWAGDRIIVHEGIYREQVNPLRGGISDEERIVYEAAPGETVEIKGSEVVTGWVHQANDTWQVVLPNSFFGAFNPYDDLVQGEWYKVSGYPRHTGAVYLNGEWLTEAPSQTAVMAPPGATPYWFGQVDGLNTTIWAQFPGVDPNTELVEINVRQSVFYPELPGRNYITVRGFTMRQAATPWAGAMSEQVGLVGTHWSKGWVIEDNEISHSVCTGITLGRYEDWRGLPAANAEGYKLSITRALEDGWSKETVGSHVVRNNHISHCEKNGIHGSLGGVFSTITGNTIHDIANLRWLGGFDRAAIKLLASFDTEISGNHIHGSFMGLWLDWMAQGARVSRNLFHDNSDRDLFLEVNHGPYLVDNNIFLSPVAIKSVSRGGAYVHNLVAGTIQVNHNDSRTTPYMLPHSTEFVAYHGNMSGDERFYNNLFVGGSGLAPYNGAILEVSMSGNVFLGGATPSSHEASPLVPVGHDPGLRLVEDPAGHLIEFDFDPAWRDVPGRSLITTARLGTTVVTEAPFENADGSPIRVDTDYFGVARSETAPFPGPFEMITAGSQMPNASARILGSMTYDTFRAMVDWNGRDSSEGADADADGLQNLLEFAFGSDPMNPASRSSLGIGLLQNSPGGSIELDYHENLDAVDLSYGLEFSVDLRDWGPWIGPPESVRRAPVAGSMMQQVTVLVPLAGTCGWWRVAVSR